MRYIYSVGLGATVLLCAACAGREGAGASSGAVGGDSSRAGPSGGGTATLVHSGTVGGSTLLTLIGGASQAGAVASGTCLGGTSSAGNSGVGIGGVSVAGTSSGGESTGGAQTGGVWTSAGSSGTADSSSGGRVGSSTPLLDASAGSTAVRRDGGPVELNATLGFDVVLDASEAERLHRLGAGVGCSNIVPETDPALVKRGLRSTDPDLRDWAYLAIEKMGYCNNLLDGQFVDCAFPYLMAAAAGADLQTAVFAIRGIGSISARTDLLTQGEVDQAYALALELRQSSDVEVRLNSVNLIDDLLRNLSDLQMFDTFAFLLSSFDAWRQTHVGLQTQPADRVAEVEDWTVGVFLRSCAYVRNATQVTDGFRSIAASLEQGQLDASIMTSVGALVRMLSEPERSQAVATVIAGIDDARGWYSVTSGPYTPANHVNDAIVLIAPFLSADEIRAVLTAIRSQSDHADFETVFGPTIELLEQRLG